MSQPRSWALSLALAPVGVLGPLGYGLGEATRVEPANDGPSTFTYEEAAACTAYLEVARVAYRDNPALRPGFVKYGLPDPARLGESVRTATAWSLVLADQAGASPEAYDQKMVIKFTLAFAERPATESEIASFMRRVSTCAVQFEPASEMVPLHEISV